MSRNHEKEKEKYWAILGVPPGSDPETLKKAYKQLAIQYHPDMNKVTTTICIRSENSNFCFQTPEAKDKFQEISRAYVVLADQGTVRFELASAGVQVLSFGVGLG